MTLRICCAHVVNIFIWKYDRTFRGASPPPETKVILRPPFQYSSWLSFNPEPPTVRRSLCWHVIESCEQWFGHRFKQSCMRVDLRVRHMKKLFVFRPPTDFDKTFRDCRYGNAAHTEHWTVWWLSLPVRHTCEMRQTIRYRKTSFAGNIVWRFSATDSWS